MLVKSKALSDQQNDPILKGDGQGVNMNQNGENNMPRPENPTLERGNKGHRTRNKVTMLNHRDCKG